MKKVPAIFDNKNWKGAKPTKASLAQSAKENKAMARTINAAERHVPRKHDSECDCPNCNNFEP
jgi:hypothetical protein